MKSATPEPTPGLEPIPRESGPICRDAIAQLGEAPTQELPRAPALPRRFPPPRSRTHTLRGAVPGLEPAARSGTPPQPSAACSIVVDVDAFPVPVMTSTAVHGGWGLKPGERDPVDHARWSEPWADPSDAPRPNLMRQTLREFEPRMRTDTTSRVSLVRSVAITPRALVHDAKPWLSRSTAMLVGFVAMLMALGIAARLPVTGTCSARGLLEHSLPGDALVTPVAGIVREIAVATGARVSSGQELAVVDPVDVRAQLAQTQAQLAQLDERLKLQRDHQEQQQRTLEGLRAQAVALRRRYDADGQRMARLREQHSSYERLMAHGFASQGGLDDLSQLMQGAWRDVLAGEQDIADNKQAQLALEQEQSRDAQALQTELSEALATRQRLESALAQGSVLSPALGRFDGPLVQVGDHVTAGQELARIVPPDAELRAVLEVSAPEHVRLRAGSHATVSIDEPSMEGWTLDGRISAIRVLSELQPSAAGGATTTMRVELELDVPPDDAESLQRLARGTQVSALLTTAPRPLLAVALDEWSAFMSTL